MPQIPLLHLSPPAIVVTPPPPVTAPMAVQDDLATLFAKNLTLTQQQQPTPQAQAPTPEDPSRIIYVSQHYTHSAHIHQQQQEQQQHPVQRPSSEPDLCDLEHVLRARGVDAAALSPPQAELFRRADDAQRARLVELWTICPPPQPSSLTWSPTSVENEEMLARRRWDEAQQQHQQYQQQQQQQQEQTTVVTDDVAMSLDGTDVETAPSSTGSPSSVQSPDGRWPASSPAVVAHAHTYMEPYMESGYEQLARREYDATCGGGGLGAASVACSKGALDPVYKATGMLDWERQQWMENQYGSFVGGWRDDEEML